MNLIVARFGLSPEKWLLIGVITAGVVILGVILRWVLKRLPKRLKTEEYSQSWKELQKLCAHPQTWPDAIIAADKLLDRALKKRSFRGKNMGARLVNAQRFFTDNDGVWYAHKLRVRLQQSPQRRLDQDDVKDALIGIRQALKDLGAL